LELTAAGTVAEFPSLTDHGIPFYSIYGFKPFLEPKPKQMYDNFSKKKVFFMKCF